MSTPIVPKKGTVRLMRVDHIAGMMRRLEWKTGVSGPLLAKEWGVTDQYLRELAADASKIVRAEVTDPDRVSAKVCTVLEAVLDDAMSGVQQGDAKSRKDAVEAAKQWAVISGAAAPKRVDMSLEGLSDAEVEAKWQEILGKLEAMKKGEE